MGQYEDFFWDVTKELDELGLRKEFDTQLKKMRSQEKHKYKEVRERWEYALNKIKKLHKINK